jgi:hypothetical protein
MCLAAASWLSLQQRCHHRYAPSAAWAVQSSRSAAGYLPKHLQELSLGCCSMQWLELDYLQQLTRLELDGMYDIKQLGHNLPDSVQQITYRRLI